MICPQLINDLDPPECSVTGLTVTIIIITRGISPRVSPGIIRDHETDALTNQRTGPSSSDQ